MPLAPSFDTCGWFTREATLLRRVGEVLLEASPVTDPAVTEFLVAQDGFELIGESAEAALRPVVLALAGRFGNARRVRVTGPARTFDDLMECFRTIQAMEISGQHRAWIAATKPAFGPDVGERFTWAQTVTAEAAGAASEEREVFKSAFGKLLEGERVLCIPTAPGIAPLASASADDLKEHRARVLGLTSLAGLSGFPQITMPLATLEGCPLGLSLIGSPGSDMKLLCLAEAATAEIASSVL